MSKEGKVALGWLLICIVIGAAGGVLSGIATFIVGIGIWLMFLALIEWISEMDDKDNRI